MFRVYWTIQNYCNKMIRLNPQMNQIMEQNPEIAHMFNNPALLRQVMEMQRNPSMMQVTTLVPHSYRSMAPTLLLIGWTLSGIFSGNDEKPGSCNDKYRKYARWISCSRKNVPRCSRTNDECYSQTKPISGTLLVKWRHSDDVTCMTQSCKSTQKPLVVSGFFSGRSKNL